MPLVKIFIALHKFEILIKIFTIVGIPYEEIYNLFFTMKHIKSYKDLYKRFIRVRMHTDVVLDQLRVYSPPQPTQVPSKP
jgi:hypothetical protein